MPLLSSPPSPSPSSIFSSDDYSRASPTISPIPPLNSFPPNLLRNPFFEELLAEESQRSLPFSPSYSPFNHTSCTASPAPDANANIKRERPRPIARQISLPSQLLTTDPVDPSRGLQSLSDCTGGHGDSFEAFASSRLNSPKTSLPLKQSRTSPVSHGCSSLLNDAQELKTCDEEPPPLPPRRLLRTPVNEICSDGWLHRGQELAVHKEAFLLSQTGVASRHRGREGDHQAFPDSHTSSQASDDISSTPQPAADVASPVPMSEEKFQKFKYEPLEDNLIHCLGGMLFEQDLYGRACLGNYRQANVSSRHLSISAEETQSSITSVSSGSRKLLDSVVPLKDLLNLSSLPSKPNLKVLDVPAPQMEEAEPSPPGATAANNVPFSMKMGDLNMNMSNCDFSLVDSESSCQREGADTLNCTRNCGETLPELTLTASGKAEAPQDVFTLKDTYITGMNSSFEITTLVNKQCNGSLGSQPCPCEVASVVPQNQGCSSPALDFGADFKKTPVDFDNNGNLQSKTSPPDRTGSFPGVTSARIRAKRVSRQSSSSSSPISPREDGGFEQLLSLVQSISGVNEGPLSYQPVKPALSSILACKNQPDLQGDHVGRAQTHPDTESYSKSSSPSIKNTLKFSQFSFEDLHAKVAPHWKTLSKTEPEPVSPTISAPSTLYDPQAEPHPTHPSGPTLPVAEARTSLTVAPSCSPSSSSSSFTTSTSNTDPSLVDALHSLLPEETQPTSILPHLESR